MESEAYTRSTRQHDWEGQKYDWLFEYHDVTCGYCLNCAQVYGMIPLCTHWHFYYTKSGGRAEEPKRQTECCSGAVW